MSQSSEAKCPFHHAAGGGTSNRDWWPEQLRLDLLHQHSSKSNPMGERFDYAAEFRSLDFAGLKKDDSRCTRAVEEAPADHADDRPVAALRPGVRTDLASFHGTPGPVRRCLHPGVVQADPPRYGTGGDTRALPRPGGSRRRAYLARPDPRRPSPAGRREGHCGAQGQGPGVGPLRLAARFDRLGLGVHLPRLRQTRRRKPVPGFVSPRRRIGRSTSQRNSRRC
jgi:hypothetical protein